MPAEPTALSTVPPPEPPADTDYDAICAAVTATARGRWFLDEFAKRNRNSDTSQVLAAIARMEATVVGERVQQASREAHQEVRIELLEMARTIAQARAEVAESGPSPAQPHAAESATALSPDVAAAAERLRQIAWTMRACGLELPASDQIAQIAETILSADALRGLGEQRAQKLTEALTYLEQRIDRMLDGHRAAASTAREADPSAANRHDGDPPLATTAVAMIAAAMRANETAAANAASAPSPAVEATPSGETASTASDVAEYPMDDDVVLTVADSAVAPAAAASLAAEPETAATEQAPAADTEPPVPVHVQALSPQDGRLELEVEPLLPTVPSTAEDDTASGFAGLELEPLAVAAADAAALPDAAPAGGDRAEAPPADAPPAEAAPAATATAEPAAAADAIALQVDRDLDGLGADAREHSPGCEAVAPPAAPAPAMPAREQTPYPQLVHAAAREDEPAEFLLEEAPRKVPVSALVASAQESRAQLSDTLAAIESELFGSTRPAETPAGPAEASIPASRPARAPAAHGPLAPLMAMSEEERVALFS